MQEKIQICHICSYYTNVLFDNLVTAQFDFADPSVFYFKKKNAIKEYDNSYVNEVNCYNEIDRLFYFYKARKVYNAYRKIYHDKRFDLNFAHSLFANGIIAYKDKVERGTPYIVAIQNTDLNYFYKLKPYLKGYAYKILSNSERIVFASSTYLNELLEKHLPNGVNKKLIKDKAVVIPYGIDDSFFENLGESHKLNDPIRVLSAGQIRWNKNHIKLARAIKLLRHDDNIILTVVGEHYNKWIVKQLGRFDFVKIKRKVNLDELRRIYQESDIFVLTSLKETFGLVYAEALSQGIPIIYSRGQGFDGQFPDGEVGYSVDASNVNDIARGIKKIINNYEKLSNNVVKKSHKYEWKIVSRQYQIMYEEILSKRKYK